jgi:hypothetical protein
MSAALRTLMKYSSGRCEGIKNRAPAWVRPVITIALVLPVTVAVLVITLGIFGLLVRLF